MPAALSLTGVSKSYGRHRVLRGLDLEVAPGESVVLLGANGSGKSTLLRVAATLARPGQGRVLVCGADAGKEPESARANLSFLTQEAPLYPELTAHEHLRWWARAQAAKASEASSAAQPARIDERLVTAGLAAVAHEPARTLSRGQRQRLALAIAFLPERPLLLLDEPFAALDGAGARWLARELAVRRGRQAVVLALHDAAQARALADRMLHLSGGTLAPLGASSTAEEAQ